MAAYNAGKSMCLVCGNNTTDEIDNSVTALWYGTCNKPSFTYQKEWYVPRTSSDGTGSTLEDIIQYMTDNSLTSLTFKVSNEHLDVIDDDDTNATFTAGQADFDEWKVPPDPPKCV